jgi:hypothetical protein
MIPDKKKKITPIKYITLYFPKNTGFPDVCRRNPKSKKI